MRSKVLGLAAGAFVMTASLAYAGTTLTQVESYSHLTNWSNHSLDFAGFDTSLGTLTTVSVTAEEFTSGTIQNTNDGTEISGIYSSGLWRFELSQAA
jgi:hypothetical protein